MYQLFNLIHQGSDTLKAYYSTLFVMDQFFELIHRFLDALNHIRAPLIQCISHMY